MLTLRKTTLSQNACVLIPVACSLSSLTATALRKIAPRKLGTSPASIAPWYTRLSTRGTEGKNCGRRSWTSSKRRRGSLVKYPILPPTDMARISERRYRRKIKESSDDMMEFGTNLINMCQRQVGDQSRVLWETGSMKIRLGSQSHMAMS